MGKIKLFLFLILIASSNVALAHGGEYFVLAFGIIWVIQFILLIQISIDKRIAGKRTFWVSGYVFMVLLPFVIGFSAGGNIGFENGLALSSLPLIFWAYYFFYKRPTK